MINLPWRVSNNGSAIVCGEGQDRRVVFGFTRFAVAEEAEYFDWLECAEQTVELHNVKLKEGGS